MPFIKQVTTSSFIRLLVCCTLVSLSTAITSPDAQQPDQSDTSSYGERLAESSAYSFNTVSNSGSGSNSHSHVHSFGQSKESDGSFYSPGVSAILNSDGFLNTMSKFSPGGVDSSKYTPSGPVEAAVHTKKTVEVIPVRFEEPREGEPQVIEISPYEVPLSIVFKTQTNKINVNQEHRSGMSKMMSGSSYQYYYYLYDLCLRVFNTSLQITFLVFYREGKNMAS